MKKITILTRADDFAHGKSHAISFWCKQNETKETMNFQKVWQFKLVIKMITFNLELL